MVLETQPSLPGSPRQRHEVRDPDRRRAAVGVTLGSNGSFTGTPTRHGTFSFSVHVTDCTPATTCTGDPAGVDRNLTWRVSAKEQQAGPQAQPVIPFGGLGGRKVARP